MILKKFTAALIASATAIIPFTAAMPNLFMPLNAYSEETADVSSFPDWIPQSLDDAVNFHNKYGAVHIGDGNDSELLCVVFQEQFYSSMKYDIKNTGGLVTVFYHDVFVDEVNDTAYEVMTYKNAATSKPDFKVQFSCDSELQNEYSFTSIGTQIVETDIYKWLPDCETEYKEYVEKHGNVSVRDNYVVFCMDSNIRIPLKWQLDSWEFLEHFKTCSYVYSYNQKTDELIQVEAYQAVKDGYANIKWEYRPDYVWELDPPFSEDDLKNTLIADCVIFNNAKTVLLPEMMRTSIVDCDTGELITFSEDTKPSISTNISISTSEGPLSVGPLLTMETNPAIIDNKIVSFFDSESFSFSMENNSLPKNYSFPNNAESVGYYDGTVSDENSMSVTRYDNGSADVVFRVKKEQSIPEKDTIRFKLINADNGKTLRLDDYEYPFGLNAAINYYLEGQALPYFISKEFYVDSNPYSLDLSSEVSSGLKFDKISRFDISLYAVPSSCNIRTDDIQKTVYENNSMDVIVPIRFIPTGDVNSDGNFGISDLVSLQKWLLGALDITFSDWKAADFFNDDKLDIFDLILMRKELIYHNSRAFILPDEFVRYSNSLIVREDDLKLYLGPNESYDCISTIPAGTRLRELGYIKNEDKWLFTEYNGQNGWIKTVKEDGMSPTVYYEDVAAKPVIYLYPEKETDVHVELELTEAELSTTYPKYNNGWDVTAYPDGNLVNKADGTHHRYLFWDAVNCRTRFDFSKGFCVAGSDTESFLKEKLTYMGLTEDEMNEFIVYWLPLMEHNRYNLISFQSEAYTDSAKLNITPTPDSMLRIFMTYVPLEEAVDIEPQQLSTFERNGFTVVEWGGSKIQ